MWGGSVSRVRLVDNVTDTRVHPVAVTVTGGKGALMQHSMTMTEAYSTGRELWECEECGRKVLLAWDPFHREVIIRGDDAAIHTGGKGGLQMVAVEAITSSS